MSGGDLTSGGPQATDSVPRRFAVTLFANVVKLAIGVTTASVVPRALGPRDYGGFQFLTAAARTSRSFLDFGASTAAYTHNAKHRASGAAAVLYARWLLIQIAILLLVILLADRLGLAPQIWPEQRVFYVWIITGLEWLTFLGTFLLQLGDAKAETVRVQKIMLVTQLVRLALFLGLYALGALALGTFVVASYVAAAITVVGVIGGFVLPKRRQYFQPAASSAEQRQCRAFFLAYARPLAVLSVAVFAHDFFDRWLLQTASGSEQQGYFALGAQWSGIVLLFTTSALNIVWREFSAANAANDRQRLRSVFEKTTRWLFLVSCVMGFLLAFNAGSFVHGLAGARYASAQPVTTLMAFYPVYQTLGQLNGVFFYATERVTLYRNLTIGALGVGVALSYVLVAPTGWLVPGLQLGAMGLAIKQVAINLVSVWVLHAFNARYLGLRIIRQLGHQLATATVVGAGTTAVFFAVTVLGPANVWARFACMGLVQAALLGAVLYRFPGLLGLTPSEMRAYWSRGRRGLRQMVAR